MLMLKIVNPCITEKSKTVQYWSDYFARGLR